LPKYYIEKTPATQNLSAINKTKDAQGTKHWQAQTRQKNTLKTGTKTASA
jgi:hypothetical protein